MSDQSSAMLRLGLEEGRTCNRSFRGPARAFSRAGHVLHAGERRVRARGGDTLVRFRVPVAREFDCPRGVDDAEAEPRAPGAVGVPDVAEFAGVEWGNRGDIKIATEAA